MKKKPYLITCTLCNNTWTLLSYSDLEVALRLKMISSCLKGEHSYNVNAYQDCTFKEVIE